MESQALLSANDVSYQEQPAVAATTRRTLARIPALKDTYKDGDVIIFNVETGADFVDTCSSWINLKVTSSELAELSSPDATILDIIREVVVYARNGTELLRQEVFNVFTREDLVARHSQEWLNTVGSAFGYGTGFGSAAAVDYAGGVTHSIPLRTLTDLFCKNQKAPPQLMSGMRIELVLDTAQRAFRWGNENAHSYTVTELVLLADTHTLTDAISRKIMSDSANDGLVQQWTDYSHISQDSSGSKVTVNFQKSVARACKALVLVRDEADVHLNLADSIGTSLFSFTTSRFRVGSLYFPRQELDRPTAHYLNTLRAYKKIQEHDDVVSSLTYPRYKARNMVATLLDRDDDLENSGISTSRAQGDLLAELGFASAANRRLDCYILYSKQISTGLSSVLVNE